MAGRGHTLLWRLANEKHWQVYETFSNQFLRAARDLADKEGDIRLRQVSISRRQLDRWYGAEMKTRPRPDQCRVLEHMFGLPIAQLFRIDDIQRENLVVDSSSADAEDDDLHGQIRNSARQSRSFVSNNDISIGDHALDQLFGDVQTLARDFLRGPLPVIFAEIAECRELIFSLLDRGPKPSQLRDLLFLGGVVTDLLAGASLDFGDPVSAITHTRAALVCAEKAEHVGLLSWVHGTQSMISLWAGQPERALEFAQRGEHLAAGGNVGAAKIWLAGLQARAHGRLGDVASMHEAFHRAETERSNHIPDDLDEIGGAMTFTTPRQLFYFAEADVLLRPNSDESRRRAIEAVAVYESAGVDEWSCLNDLLTKSNLAYSYVAGGEVAGAHEVLSPILNVEGSTYPQLLLQSLGRVDEELGGSAFRSSMEAKELRDEIRSITPVSSPVSMKVLADK